MSDVTVGVFTANEEQTIELGRAIGGLVRKGDMILLNGGLGSGKSVLARAIIRRILSQPQLEIPSPSFPLVLPYKGEGEKADWSILHADIFRFERQEELEELGLFDSPETVVLVEWAERVPALEKMAHLIISLNIPASGQGRLIEVASSADREELAQLGARFPVAP
ncbi:MAG TPA: tRNA (adenosine(37)-N6)-threonylcarbamoyltransferase complex ATPase subunit type 1 TsaE [Devosia sp.]|nr:tRNA (adenosine(37)-N6)-threonylcarbamoyltransferase complex ATPase subunit type 1 TsaE [Devosia sp.]